MRASSLACGVLLCSVACVPYTVGSMAQTVPVDEFQPGLMFTGSPMGFDIARDTTLRYLAIDGEVRWGITENSDAGVRLTSGLGAVVSYKRRLTRMVSQNSGGISMMPGFGVTSLGQYVHFEFTMLASGYQGSLTPYGGLRVMQEVRTTPSFPKDAVTYGTFGGVRMGKPDLGVSIEVGVFHDPPLVFPGTAARSRSTIIVPAIVLHGDRLVNALRGILR